MIFLRFISEGHERSDYYANRFIEYATAFLGARQCVWSRGLKQVFGIGEVSDEEIAAREDDGAQLIATIDPEMWCKVLKQPLDQRAELLRAAETSGRLAVEKMLSELL